VNPEFELVPKIFDLLCHITYLKQARNNLADRKSVSEKTVLAGAATSRVLPGESIFREC